MTWLFWLIISAIVWTLVRVMIYDLVRPRPVYRRRYVTYRANHDLIDISGEVMGETDKAFRFFDGTQTVWLPKSQCEWDEHDKTMAIPEWLAMEKGLI